MNKNLEQKSANGSKMKTQVLKILKEIYELDFSKNPCPNERYLHHYFTGKFQECFPIDYSDLSKTLLHPEWATAKHGTGGKYKENKIDGDGKTAWIDFAAGDYDSPELGIEFKFRESWDSESIVFDFIKLMDKNNSLKVAISFSIICREKELSKKLTPDVIKKTIKELKDLNEAGDKLDTERPFLFFIMEIAPHAEEKEKKDKKQAWYCNDLGKGFEECNDADKINFKTV